MFNDKVSPETLKAVYDIKYNHKDMLSMREQVHKVIEQGGKFEVLADGAVRVVFDERNMNDKQIQELQQRISADKAVLTV